MAILKLGMNQGKQGQTRSQRQGDFKDNFYSLWVLLGTL
jgi:hypothetical protein